MNIDQLLGTAGTAPTQATPGHGKKALGQDDFIKLLVAQMNNQDPSNPTDNAQFLSQIAQFTMVKGIDKLGTSFDSIAGDYFTNQAMQASQLVGHQVLNEGNSGWLLPNRPLEGTIEVPELTDAVNIQVRDASGRLVKTLDSNDFAAGVYPFAWGGINEQGEQVAPGQYSITATGLVNGTQQALPVQMYNTVESITVDRSSNSVQLQLDNDQQIPFSGISQYR